MEQPQVPFIVAMKYHPKPIDNRKITHELAEFLRCHLINEVDIIQTLQKKSLSTSSNSTIKPHQDFNELSFELVSQIAAAQLGLKFNVVINMLMFNDARLKKLQELDVSAGKVRLIIIQSPTNVDNDQDDYDGRHILQVRIDDNEPFNNMNEVATKVLNLLKKDDDARKTSNKTQKKLTVLPANDHLHELVLSEHPRKEKILCKRCSKLVSGPSYECAECNEFTFHKLCAEVSPNIVTRPNCFIENKPKQYDFKKRYKCSDCEEFLEDCCGCLIQTNVMNGFLPPVLYHTNHPHFLNLIIMPFMINYQYKCCVCDKEGSTVSYKCYDCFYDVHVNCLLPLLPLSRTKFFDDNALMKKIQATHAPNGHVLLDSKLLLHVVKDIFQHAAPIGLVTVVQNLEAYQARVDASKDVFYDNFRSVYTMNKISREIYHKYTTDEHTTTLAILNLLSKHSWEAKVILTLAAFAVNYSKFWLVMKHFATNPVAKMVAFLKQLPNKLEGFKPQFEELNNLIKAILDVAKCMVELKEQVPFQHMAPDKPEMVTLTAFLSLAAYWTIRSIVTCTSQIISLHFYVEYIASISETWKLTSLAYKLKSIHENLMKQLTLWRVTYR